MGCRFYYADERLPTAGTTTTTTTTTATTARGCAAAASGAGRYAALAGSSRLGTGPPPEGESAAALARDQGPRPPL
eukprot:CAMPEP_0173267474 /NCGR_PEP_ID=MMETSP1142-20121109/29784_1 /TAXON_ID=483371 /ORGANISM="non described non described, Strain CCMP2298" /LENGTH=75 /DNA_ID=CAMNT_0014203595 /DNA_START=387 /DNA_END=615 /DNA_ORIENTATION=+